MHIMHHCVVLHAYNKCVKYESNAIHRTHIAKRNRLTLFSQEALLHSCIKTEVLKNLQLLIFIVGNSTYSWGLDKSSRLRGLQTGSFRLAPTTHIIIPRKITSSMWAVKMCTKHSPPPNLCPPSDIHVGRYVVVVVHQNLWISACLFSSCFFCSSNSFNCWSARSPNFASL